jgi:hypothetical protein
VWRAFAALLLAVIAQSGGRPGLAQSGCYAPEDAAAHVGEYACVSGRVTFVLWAQQANGQPTFVNLGSRFTVLIWIEDRDKFQPAPETWRGTTLTVWGMIQLYQGRAEIILRSPVQLAGPAAPSPSTPTPAVPAPAPLPPAQQAAPPAPVPVPRTPPPPAMPLAPATPPPPRPSTPAPPPPPTPASTPTPRPAATPTPEPTSEPTSEPTPDPAPVPTPSPTPSPTHVAIPSPAVVPSAPGGAPRAQARLTAPPAAVEGPIDARPPLERPDNAPAPPRLLVAGAVALVVLGIAGSIIVGRKRT